MKKTSLILVSVFYFQANAQEITKDTLNTKKESHTEVAEVIITSTRSNRSIRKIPTRIEFIAGEELDEKSNMRPSDLRVLLSESTGIQVQTTSPISANASIRIQGLDGRYTQILKDGFPIYSGAASGLGLLQTPPLDLKQVEVIKGASSTLYGGGAIAGLVNLISKTPTEKRDLRFHINGTNAKGLDFNAFYGQKFGSVGTTIFFSHSRNQAYAPKNTAFSAIPKFERYVLNPKFFWYISENTKLNFGLNAMKEHRLGGNMNYLKGNLSPEFLYFEKNNTERYGSQFSFKHQFNNASFIEIKNSINYFNRKIQIPDYQFEGRQISSFTEGFYSLKKEKTDWIFGLNIINDNFKEKPNNMPFIRNYNENIFGIFAQNSWKTTPWLEVETGLRTDFVKNYGAVFLPKISALVHFSKNLTSRIGGGLGYKTPTLFTEETERLHYRNILPIDNKINKLEKSYGANFDINYQNKWGDWSLNINQLLFYTYLKNPLLLSPISSTTYQMENVNGDIHTKGLETNVKLSYQDWKLFLGYTFTDTKLHQNHQFSQNLLTPKHRINSVLFYEIEEKWKLGLEAYYFSNQLLSNNEIGKSYWNLGFMVEKLWENFSIYANFENFLDARQTRFGTIYTGSQNRPFFKDIYAPLDGFVINAGIKLKF